MIDLKELKIDINNFVIGKIVHFPGKKDLFLFDTMGMEMMQVSSDMEIKGRLLLSQIAPIKQIDYVFFDTEDESLIIADSIIGKVFKSKYTFNDSSGLELANAIEFPINTGSILVAGSPIGEEYWMLDKGSSMLRFYNKNFEELRTLGSRMGYVLAYGEEVAQRMGFEYPEDMKISKDFSRIVVSDSGNKRLVILVEDRGKSQWKMEKSIMLPEFPYKILLWDETEDKVFLSDFDQSVIMVSLKYGFISKEELNYSVDFGAVDYDQSKNNQLHINSEKNGEIITLTLPVLSVEEMARRAENNYVLMRCHIDQEQYEKARQLVDDHAELLPEYMRHKSGGDTYFDERLVGLVENKFNKISAENKKLSDKIVELSHLFIIKYKSTPESSDNEAANIDKENIRHKMFLKLKQFRKGLKELAELKVIVRNSVPAATLLAGLLHSRFDCIKEKLHTHLKVVNVNLEEFCELDFLKTIVHFWLLSEEEGVLFKERGLKYYKPFGGKFLLAVLNDFYYHIAELFLNYQKTDQYISYADREITMYPDKMGIFNRFVNRLIILKKYDDVLRMLKKIPDANKENVNFYYYQVYLGKAEKAKAFEYLKKELDLYPHRVHLIPRLIELGQLTVGETQQYIDKLLEKSGHSIDIYFNTAQAFYSMGDFSQAEIYVDRELELFPENKHAFQLKFHLFFRHPGGSMDKAYYRKNWEIFKNFMRFNRDEIIAMQVVGFFRVLNYVTLDTVELKELVALKNTITFGLYKKQLNFYLSYITHLHGALNQLESSQKTEIEAYDSEAYLSAISTCQLAYEFYLKEVQRMAVEDGDKEKIFELIECILKYNPGNEEIFQFLDRLSLKEEEIVEKI